MIKLIKKKVQQLTCDHSDIESGMSGAIIYTADDYYKCRKCGLYGSDSVFRDNATRRNYDKLEKLYFEQRVARRSRG